MDLDLPLLAQVRLESRQRYMALVIHFLTIPLYDVMTLVASGSHQPPRDWGLDPTIERPDYGACYRLVAGPAELGGEGGERGLSRPCARSLGPAATAGIGRSAHGNGPIGLKSHRPRPGGGIGRHAALRGL